MITEIYTRKSIIKLIENRQDPTKLQPKEEKLTIVFSDIRNFTTISENNMPIDTVVILNNYFDKMNKCIIQNDGEHVLIEQVINIHKQLIGK